MGAVVTPPPFLLSRNMFPCLHPVITVSMAKLQINEGNAKEKLVFLFALPSASNFGAARVTKICSRKVISLRSLPFFVRVLAAGSGSGVLPIPVRGTPR